MTEEVKREAWERPVVVQMDASDAEMMRGSFAERMSNMEMMNS